MIILQIILLIDHVLKLLVMITVVLIILLAVGIAVYLLKPCNFFLYWLGIQPYFLPVFFVLFGDNMMPIEDNYLPRLYFRCHDIFCGLMLLLFCISYVKNIKYLTSFKVLLIPLLLIILFIIVQNILVGFSTIALYLNIINILRNIAPFALLLIDKNVRPNRETFIRFIKIFVFVQLFFSLLNLFDYKIYGDYSAKFDENLICGTFARYNHMANYLSSFFFILTNEYYEYKEMKGNTYLFLTAIIGLLIIISGSRMTLILFTFTSLFYFFIYHGKKFGILTLMGVIFLFSTFISGNEAFLGQNADEGTGLERNMIGIIDLANSDDMTEGNTLSMSAYVLLTYFNSPLLGNGKAYRPEHYYGHPSDTYNNEDIFRTDARLAFVFVEYGILGLFLFFLLYVTIFKCCHFFSEENSRIFFIGVFIYFFLFSLTDNGFWDYFQFSIPLIYAFSIKNKQGLSYHGAYENTKQL